MYNNRPVWLWWGELWGGGEKKLPSSESCSLPRSPYLFVRGTARCWQWGRAKSHHLRQPRSWVLPWIVSTSHGDLQGNQQQQEVALWGVRTGREIKVSGGLGLKPTLLNCFLTRKGKKKNYGRGLWSAVVLCFRHQGRQDSISITVPLGPWWHHLVSPDTGHWAG